MLKIILSVLITATIGFSSIAQASEAVKPTEEATLKCQEPANGKVKCYDFKEKKEVEFPMP